MNGDIFAADFKTTPYWWEAAAPSRHGETGLPEQSDVVIVGSGYSGLSAALELARSGTQVSVLDAEDIGWGASTRNGGMLSGEPKFAAAEELRKRYGEIQTERILEDGRSTLDNLKEVVEREGIECFVQQNGRFVGAHCPSAYKDLERKARELEKEGIEGFELIPRERLHEVTESEYYYGGLLQDDGGCLHPGLYHAGLVAACQRQGVQFFSQTRVTGIAKDPGGYVVTTSRGTIRAEEAMLGTNGYTGQATPWHARRLIPLGSYIIATEPLPTERIDSMFRNYCTMSNTQRILYYYRPSPDYTRVIFGGRASFTDTDEKRSSKTLYEYLCGVFPQLRGVKITHGWSGNVAFTFDLLPHMGTQDGVHYCMGCNGSGVQMMSFLGRQIALKILGKTNRPCGFDGIPFDSRPLYSGNPWFLPIVGNYYRLRDRLERALA